MNAFKFNNDNIIVITNTGFEKYFNSLKHSDKIKYAIKINIAC